VTDIAIFRDAYAPLIRAATVLPSPDARQGPDATRVAADALAAHLETHHAETAALIVEPLVQCAAGMAMHDPEYLSLARAICDRYEVHLICDEIAVGFGRTGTFFAHEQAGIRPDFLCLSKGITGGYLPLSVVMTRNAIYEAFLDDTAARGFLHSHSYTGNPLACRAALATLDIFEQDDVLAANIEPGNRIDAQLQPLMDHPRVRHYRRRGMIFAFDVNGVPSFGHRFYRAALERGVLVRPIANTVYLMPPYVLGEAEIEHLCGGVAEALECVLNS
jgi:adenosylmethionine---8-amino-7-oxononanoate aminotransferase